MAEGGRPQGSEVELVIEEPFVSFGINVDWVNVETWMPEEELRLGRSVVVRVYGRSFTGKLESYWVHKAAFLSNREGRQVNVDLTIERRG